MSGDKQRKSTQAGSYSFRNREKVKKTSKGGIDESDYGRASTGKYKKRMALKKK